MADSVSNGVLNILDPGFANGNGNITAKYGSAEIMIRSIRVFKNNGSAKYKKVITLPAETHTCSYSVSTESSHPHNKYNICSCGKKVYLGKDTVSSCSSCYPVGNVNLTRSFEKTKGTATFYRNTVSNADSYTLKLYKNNSLYNTYTMSNSTYYVSGLPSGSYSAVLYAKNASTGEERHSSCDSFRIVDTYTVSYNANGGSNAPSSQTKIEDTPLTITSSIPQKEGYVFKGWAKSKNAVTPQYLSGDSYETNANITLYAVWEPEVYTVTFDANGGTGTLESKTITYGNTMKMPNNILKEGYYLRGWATSPKAATAEYRLDLDYKVTQNLTLYAVWGESTWSGEVASEFAGGDGTENNPYQISNSAELALLAKKVNLQTSFSMEYYALTDNIDLNYENWVPIGLGENDYQGFYGYLEGNGYTVSGLYISGSDYSCYGLFGMAGYPSYYGYCGATIRNLTVQGDIENIKRSGNTFNGGVVGAYSGSLILENVEATYLDISNVSVGNTDDNVTLQIGGILGGKGGTSLKMNNCSVNQVTFSFDLTEETVGYVGGILGNFGNTYRNEAITNCMVDEEDGIFGNIKVATDSTLYIGGICGYGAVSNCYIRSGRLTDKLDVDGYVRAGGITGGGDVENSSVNFTDRDTIYYKGDRVPYSLYICAKGGQIGGITGGGNVQNSKYNGASLLLEAKENIGRYRYSLVGGISPWAYPCEIENVVANVDGIISACSKDASVQASGITSVPAFNLFTGHSYSDVEHGIKKSMLTADKIYAENNGTELYYERYVVAADIEDAVTNVDKVYVNDNLILKASIYGGGSGDIETPICGTQQNAVYKSITKLKTKSFQKNLLKLNEYQSVSELEDDPSAVWVLKDGEFPEYYYNCLNDITVSDDIENGTITIDKTQAIDGEVVTVTAMPNEGYVLNKIYVNGAEKDGTTFIVSGDSEVFATFSEKIAEYSVAVTASENASATVANVDSAEPMPMSMGETGSQTTALTAKDGEEILVTANADEDYTVDTIYVNGEEIAGDSFILTDNTTVTMDVTSISTEIRATTDDAEDVGSYFAIVSGRIADADEETVKYIRYWSADDTQTVYTTEPETGNGTYTAELMDLNASTTYYYQMTELGEVKSFTTEEEIIPVLEDNENKEEGDGYVGDEDGEHDDGEDDGDSGTSTSSITTTTYKTLASTYKFSIECSRALTTEFLAIACYDHAGNLLALSQIICDGDTSYTASVPIDANIDYAKIFVWRGLSDMKPLAGAEIVEIAKK